MRTAGILMPITSLPSPYGVGTLGQCARDFIQFLHRAGIGGEGLVRGIPISCWTYRKYLPVCLSGTM